LAVSQGLRAAVPARLAAATIHLACQSTVHSLTAAGAVAAPAALLAQGVLRTMWVSRLTVYGALLLGMGAAGTSIGVLHSGSAAEQPQANDPPAQVARADDAPKKEEKKDEQANPQDTINHLKLLALGMHNYHDTYGQFPPAAVYSMDGKPLLSWRVLLLPKLDQKELFKQFKLDEPWDSPNNKKLLEKMPSIYASGSGKNQERFTTHYQVFTGPGTIFDNMQGRQIREILDGTSNTILIAQAATAVPWTKPDDLVFAANKPIPRLGSPALKGFYTAFADGSVRLLRRDWNAQQEQQMRLIIQRNDGTPVDATQLAP
jgi:hypothetical protein